MSATAHENCVRCGRVVGEGAMQCYQPMSAECTSRVVEALRARVAELEHAVEAARVRGVLLDGVLKTRSERVSELEALEARAQGQLSIAHGAYELASKERVDLEAEIAQLKGDDTALRAEIARLCQIGGQEEVAFRAQFAALEAKLRLCPGCGAAKDGDIWEQGHSAECWVFHGQRMREERDTYRDGLREAQRARDEARAENDKWQARVETLVRELNAADALAREREAKRDGEG